ncbi:aminotransferase class I/II-fold pyridoxal phosphate-dependent enzyme [Teredinibacter sp. KSP-S5-2]|uniref:aminotransferase class I/II-fold pyridoxal phosphate-dependent enzyme n=1 Tax=Teredinibacter sp. KSP-S5-2 TaxID=3034506 RepID=UPI002934357D|nr:aminotransferase class I/II-fold pyridoxal phosphate-dependent enzyme [Teredinibacter sp. KSP-S5-2]WNO09553.1 aminotransferase class I/II-fold pyridoxal phosphate-dependent enzyme [Teredinibacter sp. KSP-S5-2]
MNLTNASQEQLQNLEQTLAAEFSTIKAKNLSLDLTRGKPSAEQVSLSDSLDGILKGNYTSKSGIDVRNYGGLEGIPEARELGASILGVPASNVLAGGNSSLTLMHQVMTVAHIFGLNGPESAWNKQSSVKFLCPVPGYDRHFSVCEHLGIEMVTVPMTSTGPDMDKVEEMLKADSSIKGMWCVPKYSNPTGVIYSDETVERIAQLGKIAGDGFRVMWDNAYAIHDLTDNPVQLANIFEACAKAGTEDSVIQFASTSKITHAGSGVAFVAASDANLAGFKKSLGFITIGPDKVNQLRHVNFFAEEGSLNAHMKKHAEIIKPRFASVLKHLEEAFGDNDLGAWESAEGGYFISFDTRPGLAQEVVDMADEAGVKLTPAGATFPYGNDPQDSNIRIAPTVPTVEQVDEAMQVFVLCVKLASVRQALKNA